ncbi:hypothetical protein HZA33_02185 [Candidatus Pacearchaeota archaeon]|nr:hypothetical protein [Candidatus Pacearchaeota archaeon]
MNKIALLGLSALVLLSPLAAEAKTKPVKVKTPTIVAKGKNVYINYEKLTDFRITKQAEYKFDWPTMDSKLLFSLKKNNLEIVVGVSAVNVKISQTLHPGDGTPEVFVVPGKSFSLGNSFSDFFSDVKVYCDDDFIAMAGEKIKYTNPLYGYNNLEDTPFLDAEIKKEMKGVHSFKIHPGAGDWERAEFFSEKGNKLVETGFDMRNY